MRIVKWFIVSIALALIIIYFTGDYIARKILHYGLEYAEPELARHGITIKQFDYSKALLYSFKSFSIKDVNVKFDLEKEIYGKKSFHAEFNSESIIVRLTHFNDPTIRLTLNDFNLYIQSNDENSDIPFGKFENASWKGETPVKLYDLKESGEIIIDRLNTLFRENSIPDPMDFEGEALLNIDNRDIRIRMHTERREDRTYLKFNKQDIIDASRDFEDIRISDEEADLISRYPARALHILKITRDAERISEKEKEEDEEFPEDAFKHIYWSYHLTRTFGEEFAKELTDAHETIPNNTLQQRKMDFHNNEFGRKLASDYLSQEELKNIVLNSPEVIRIPDQKN
jgi:hypothetical protein